MELVMGVEVPVLARAVVAWTGWGTESRPLRDDAAFVRSVGGPDADRLLAAVQALDDAFYQSDANLVAPSLEAMGDLVERDFRSRFPSLPPEVGAAFAWCYTFDFK